MKLARRITGSRYLAYHIENLQGDQDEDV